MEVAERDEVEAVEDGGGHLRGAADAERTLAVLGRDGAGDEGVRHEDATRVRRRGRQRAGDAGRDDALLIVDGVVGVGVARLRGVGEREGVHVHGSVLVGEHHRRGRLRQLARQVQPALAQERGGEADAHRAVVVAGDRDHRDAAPVHEFREHFVQQLDRPGRRDGAIVEVAGHEHGCRLYVVHQIEQLPQHVPLVVGEGTGCGRAARGASRRCG